MTILAKRGIVQSDLSATQINYRSFVKELRAPSFHRGIFQIQGINPGNPDFPCYIEALLRQELSENSDPFLNGDIWRINDQFLRPNSVCFDSGRPFQLNSVRADNPHARLAHQTVALDMNVTTFNVQHLRMRRAGYPQLTRAKVDISIGIEFEDVTA